jgi:glycosyltransferase involved in cell wall biosynthesis
VSAHRIFFVNRFYWPDEPATAQLLTDLAEELAEAGHAVTVVTGQSRATRRPTLEAHRGVDIIRVPSGTLDRRDTLQRTIDFFKFARGARQALTHEARPGDTVVMMTDPPLLNGFLAATARRRGWRVIHWIQDVFPEVAAVIQGGGLLKCLRPFRDRAWNDAQACVTLGRDMANFVRSRGVTETALHISANWAPRGVGPAALDAIAAKRNAWGLTGQFVVGYSGNLGRVHELFPVLDIAEALRHEPNIVFVFIGNGAQRKPLEAAARARGLDRIRFMPPQPREELSTVLSIADVHLVSLRRGCEAFVFPSKLYGIAAAGRPVLFIGSKTSELAEQVEARGFGKSISPEETAEAAEAIRAWRNNPEVLEPMKTAALAFAREHTLEQRVRFWTVLLEAGKSLAPAAGSPESSSAE